MTVILTYWITMAGGALMLLLALFIPRLRLWFGGRPWTEVFTEQRLIRIARLQERLAQGSLAAMGAGFLISGIGPLLNLPATPAQLAASLCYGLALAGLVAQVALIVRSRNL